MMFRNSRISSLYLWLFVSSALPKHGAAFGAPCLANDFAIAYHGNTVFSVSSENKTCSCNNYASDGVASFRTAVIPSLSTTSVGSVNGSGVSFLDTAKFNAGLLVANGSIYGPGAAGSRQVEVADVLKVGSLASISGSYQCTGLQARYYASQNLQDPPACVQTEPIMSLAWGGGPCPVCAGAVSCTSWSARYNGFLLAPTTGNVTISFLVTGGLRVWFNNAPQPVIDSWSGQTAQFYTASVIMVQGQYYPIRVEYLQAQSSYQLLFQWHWAGSGSALVPTSRMCTAAGVQVDAGTSTFSDQVNFDGPVLFGHGIGSPAAWTKHLGPVMHGESALFVKGATLANGQTFSYGTGLIAGTGPIISGNHVVNGVLNVTGASYYGGSVVTSANVAVGGPLTVAGNATVSGALVAGPLSATTVATSGLFTASAGLTVAGGTLTAGPISAGAIAATTVGAAGLITASAGLTVSSGTLTAGPINAGAVSVTTLGASGAVTLTSSTASTTSSNGALVVQGGVGVGGALNVAGLVTASAGLTVASGTLTAGPISAGAIVATTVGAGGLVTASAGLTVSSGTLTAGPINAGAVSVTTLGASGVVTLTSSIASTTSSNGALVVQGGVGVGGALNVAGVTRFTISTASTSSTTGAVVVTGGVGIGGALNVAAGISAQSLTFGDSTVMSTAPFGAPISFQFTAAYTNGQWFSITNTPNLPTGAYFIDVKFDSARNGRGGNMWFPHVFGILSFYQGTNDVNFCSGVPISVSAHAMNGGTSVQMRYCCRGASLGIIQMMITGETNSNIIMNFVLTPLSGSTQAAYPY